MNDLDARIERARRHVAMSWDEDHVDLVLVAVRRRGAARRRRRRAGLLAVVLALGVGLALQGRDRAGPPAAGMAAAGGGAAVAIDYRDGSRALALDGRTEMRVTEEAPARVVTEVRAGRGRFDVRLRPERQFR